MRGTEGGSASLVWVVWVRDPPPSAHPDRWCGAVGSPAAVKLVLALSKAVDYCLKPHRIRQSFHCEHTRLGC